ncbi:imidazoleglycerol-phosphate dehydratase [Yoonia sp. 2307UL14-13]|uniref:imidazoleglycerol-phosphate dehydratase n=1 Tax=Yoonia sp. 2307UL14-13 TaxID=3126506 RepID=UPI0030A95A4E
MKAMIMREQADKATETAQVLMDKGFQVVCVESQRYARAVLAAEPIDLLVLDETIHGRLTHAVALLGELRHPYISTILMTDLQGGDMGELYDLIPSLYAMAGCDISGDVLGKLAIAAIENVDQAAVRVARHQAADLAEAALDDAMPELIADDAPRKSDPMAALAAAIAKPDADEILILTEKDKTTLPHFVRRPTSRTISAPQFARISRSADASLALQ